MSSEQGQLTVGFKVPPIYKPLWGNAWYKGVYGGRGSGKSWACALLCITSSLGGGVRGACIREVQKLLTHSSKRLIEDLISRLNLDGAFQPRHSDIKTPGGGEITFHGMSEFNNENIKSLEDVDWVWIEEGQLFGELSWELLYPTIRKNESQIVVSWNPRSPSDVIDKFFRGENKRTENVILVEAQYTDNPYFTAKLEADRKFDYENNPDRYAHIWLGDYEPQVAGALWRREIFQQWRKREMLTDRLRTVVSIDPAVSNTEKSDEHGIVVCAQGMDKRGYLLEDGSMHGFPKSWAERAVALYDKWDADAIIIERNQGGDMCRHTLETIRRPLPIREVTATRGKHVRAEPISALYTLGKISHVGSYPEIETQLTRFTPSGYQGPKSPDRAEALIWAFSDLFPRLTSPHKEASSDSTPFNPFWRPQSEEGWMS